MTAIIATDACCIHLEGSSLKPETVSRLTTVRINKIKECSNRWAAVSKQPEHSLAVKLQNTTLSTDHVCHQSCYSKYTNVSKIEKAEKSHLKKSSTVTLLESVPSSDEEKTKNSESESTAKLLRSTSTVRARRRTSVLDPTCIICQRLGKFIKSKRTHKRKSEALSQTQTLTAGLLKKAAEIRNDHRILMYVRDADPVASEVRYHKSCYQTYTNFLHYEPKGGSLAYYVCSHVNSIKRLFTFYRHEDDELYRSFCESVVIKRIIEGKECFTMTDLVALYNKHKDDREGFMTSAKLKYRLRKQFDRLVFYKPANRSRSEIVYAETASLSDIVADDSFRLARSSTTSEDSVDCNLSQSILSSASNVNRELYYSGLHIRNAIEDSTKEKCFSWPPTPDEFSHEQCLMTVPVDLFNMIATIVGENDEPKPDSHVEVSKDVQLKILSICQDIIYLHSNGKKPTPKSLALGITLRHMTGSSAISKLLNGLGHSCSYDTSVRMETAFAMKAVSEHHDGFIPPTFAKHKFAFLVFDNIDFAEETLSGHGTTHHTNGILVQQTDEEIEATASTATASTKVSTDHLISKRSRSFLPALTDIQPYHLGKRHGPEGILKYAEDSLKEAKSRVDKASAKDFVYVALKHVSKGDVPAWTGFNSTSQKLVLPKSQIHYLPVIEAPATEMSTICHVLERSLNICKELEIPNIVVVFDQAIYAKAQQVRWKNETMKSRLVVRLGEFHTMMTFMGVIGKRFQLSGLEDILIESGVVAPGSIKGVSSGHMYNRAIRSHKLLFEALGRLQLANFLDSLDETSSQQFDTVMQSIKTSYINTGEVNSANLEEIRSQFLTHVERECQQSSTYRFWNSYMDLVGILLNFLRATRDSNWALHLDSLRAMLPWFFAYDRINYSRYVRKHIHTNKN
ncbi:uncharacterized protein [Watersipora subatra]|uniref:uncharacterized protein n=1 Tax=Watersipora subatra TaxID=2589382 RepID=UPI00355B7894